MNWYDLEVEAFSTHPEIQTAFRRSGRVKPWEFVVMIPAGLLFVLCLLAPILGLAAISQNRFQDYTAPAEDMIPLAGSFYAVALTVQLAMIVWWLVRGRRPSWGAMLYSVMVVALGSLAGVAIMLRAEEEQLIDWQGWAVVVWFSVVVSAVFWLLLFITRLAGRTARSDSDSDSDYINRLSPKKLKLLAHRRSLVADLSEQDQASMRQLRNASIREILAEGAISEQTAERALDAELGALQLTMLVR